MPKLSRALVLAVMLAVPALSESKAQTPTSPSTGTQNEIIYFVGEYTKSVVYGVIIGGILMNITVGGSGSTLAGAVAGSTLGGLLFLQGEAHNYVIHHVGYPENK